MVVTTGIIVIALTLIIYKLYKWMWTGYDYFEKQGLPFVKPYPFMGSLWSLLKKSSNVRYFLIDIYEKFPTAPIFGLYDQSRVTYVLRDPELAKLIGVKAFDYFPEHRQVIDEEKEPLFGNNLVNLKGQKWKDMRATLSPMFTGSKMRFMFELVSEIGAQMAEYFKRVSKENRIVEFKETFARFTTDVIGTTAFGIKVDSLKDKKNDFFMTADSIMNFKGFITGIRLMIVFLLPKLAKLLRMKMISEKKTKFIVNLITEAMTVREEQGIVRPDLIHLLLQIKKGMLKLESHEDDVTHENFAAVEESEVGRVVVRRQWSDNELMSQCLIFFLAGYDTSSTVMSLIAYELATNKDVQEKLIAEIDEVNASLNGKHLTYDALQKMKYIDVVITEGLRVWPAGELTERVCIKDYTIKLNQGQEITIKKGENVWIPIIAYHMDPNHFENPKKFNPERFSEENRHKINLSMYMPFGIGPRNCIGSRFALMQMKIGFYYLLLNFTLEVCDKTQVPLKLIKGTRTQPEKGIWLELRPREQKLT